MNENLVEEIIESGMTFVLDVNSSYRIEKSKNVEKLNNVRIVEFVRLSKGSVEFVEAKTSAPNPNNPENRDNIQMFITEIREKFQNSISLLNAAVIKRRKEIFDELPVSMQKYNWAKADYKLYLVIKNHEEKWLDQLSPLIKKEVKPFLKCWNIPDINFKIINEELAKELNVVKNLEA